MSLLSIISDPAKGCAVRCGLTPPTQLFGSSDPNAPLLIALAQEEGEELARRHDWQALIAVGGGAADGTITFTLPSDYDRFARYSTIRNATLHQLYDGPVLDETTWRSIVRGDIAPLLGAWRLSGSGSLFIVPAPVAGQLVEYTYYSKNFVRSNVGTAKDAFSADTDTTVIPERLIGLGIIWRWKKDKGFAYAEHMATYEREVERACSRDRGPAEPILLSKPRPLTGISSSGISSTWPGRIIV